MKFKPEVIQKSAQGWIGNDTKCNLFIYQMNELIF